MALNLDDIVDKAKGLVQTGVAKSRQLGEIAKLKASNLSEEDTIKKAYTDLGKLYYAERGTAPDAAYAELCGKITAAKVNMEENRNRIEQLKAESGLDELAENAQEAGAVISEKAKSTAESLKAKVDEALKCAGQAKNEVKEQAQDAAETVTDTLKDAEDELELAVSELKDENGEGEA